MKRRFVMALIFLAVLFFAAAPLLLVCHAADPLTMQGLSTNTKPTSVPGGSTFYETDTTNTYTFRVYPDGTRAWVLSTTGSATTFYLATLASNQASTITATAAELNNMHNNTSTAAELSTLHSVTAGTNSASKALVTDANKSVDQLHAGALYLGTSGSDTQVTETAAEMNFFAGIPTTASQASTPATGSNATQFTFKNAAGSTIGRIYSGLAYISDINGGHSAAITSMAIATNGSLSTLVTGKVIEFTTTAGGLLGITFTATTGSYYITFVMPGGKIVTSTVLTVN